ncbi:hypothetical protein [Sphingobacterium paludis]|uniref:hypothetical protein n=1 Tax=Sphingobacterium paludis TaxID=1476465 RepID=UPI0014151EEE|nr:hypothetical protein [Sphingobacterium paludis]
MKIKQLTLYSNKIAEQRHFFEATLGLSVQEESSDLFWVQVGCTSRGVLNIIAITIVS